MTNNPETSSDQDLLSAEQIVSHATREQLLVLDCNLGVVAASKSFHTAFRVAPGDTIGKKLADLGNGQWNIPALLTMLKEVPKDDGEFHDLAQEHTVGPRTMQVSARRLPGAPDQILLSVFDIKGQKLV